VIDHFTFPQATLEYVCKERDFMRKLSSIIKEMLTTVNFDGLRCTFKRDPGVRDIMEALKRQKEIDMSTRSNKNPVDRSDYTAS